MASSKAKGGKAPRASRAPHVEPPGELRAALDSSPGLRESWEDLPDSRRRELAGAVASSDRPETRLQRVVQIVHLLSALFHRKSVG